MCYSTPTSHPFISEKEKEYLSEKIVGIQHGEITVSSIPWRKLFTSPPVLALVVAQIGHTWGLFTMITDLPKYMNDVLHFSIKQNGFYSALPYAVMWIVSIITGIFTDFVIARKWFSVTSLRKVMTVICKFEYLYLMRKIVGKKCTFIFMKLQLVQEHFYWPLRMPGVIK